MPEIVNSHLALDHPLHEAELSVDLVLDPRQLLEYPRILRETGCV